MNKILLTTCTILLFSSLWAQETVEKTFSGVESIRLSTASGDGIIKKGSGKDVKVTLYYTYDDDDFEYTMEQDGTRLRLKEEFEHGSYSGTSRWTLEIPDGMDINFNTGSGDLEIADLELEIRSNLGSGDVNLEKINGDVRINTGSGNVDIADQKGEMSVNTGSGDLELRGGEGIVDLNAGSGDIRISNVTGGFSINTGSGDIRAENLSIAEASSFNSGSGNSKVILKDELKHDISINSGSGNSSLDFNNTAIAGEIVMEANQRNGRIVAPFSFDKEEEIERGNQTYIRKTVQKGSSQVKIKIRTGSGTAEIIQ